MKNIVFILNVPAFYKINLLRELTDSYNITAIILGRTNQVVSEKELSQLGFKTIVLSQDDMDVKWKGVFRARKLWKTLCKLNPDKIIFTGWDNIDLVINAFLSKKRRNCVISESSIFESDTHGLKARLKKIILKRFATALPSGKPHEELLLKLGFQGKMIITGSVGINNPIDHIDRQKNHPPKYLYIGRLIDIKNVRMMVEVFNFINRPLTIVGDGPLREELEKSSHPNVKFYGFASRDEVKRLLGEHDCLVLPSKREPWGLVVEEALMSGMPVLASNKVGSSVDLIKEYDSGVLFDPYDKEDFIKGVEQIENNYSQLKSNALNIDFAEREQNYINAFKQAFES